VAHKLKSRLPRNEAAQRRYVLMMQYVAIHVDLYGVAKEAYDLKATGDEQVREALGSTSVSTRRLRCGKAREEWYGSFARKLLRPIQSHHHHDHSRHRNACDHVERWHPNVSWRLWNHGSW
jgi:hypothetical protein